MACLIFVVDSKPRIYYHGFMYNIYKLDNGLYQIHTPPNQPSLEGPLLAILTHATFNLGFDPDELEYALLVMINEEKDAAHFGINRTFIYPFNRKDKKVG